MPSISATTAPRPDLPQACTIADFFRIFGAEIHNLEEFSARLEEAERRFGKSEIFIDLATWKADVDKLYLWENCTSIYDFLGQQRIGSFPHEKSSICGAIKRAEALVSLTKGLYHRNMIEYLERQGHATGRGIYDANGSPIGFSLVDFAFHKTKLVALHKLVQSGKAPLEPDWDMFFDSGYAEYKAYCFSKMTGKPSGSFVPQGNPADDSHRPGRRLEERHDPPSDPLDPFSGNTRPVLSENTDALEGLAVQPVRLSLPKFSTDWLPLGSLPHLAWLALEKRDTVMSSLSDSGKIDRTIQQEEAN